MATEYDRPPIVEAVVEVRTSSPVDVEDLRRLAGHALTRYARSEDEVEIEFKLDLGGMSTSDGKPSGFRLISEDAAQVLLYRKDAIVVAQQAPYPGWGAFSERVRDELRKWEKGAARNKSFSRLGIRYQNRIDVPTNQGVFNPNLYLTLLPQRPGVLTGKAQGFYAGIAACQVNDYLVSANVGMGVSPLIDHIGLVVDIDVFTESVRSFDDLMAKLEGVRDTKNAVFESLITDAARATFSV